MARDWMKKLATLPGAVEDYEDPHATVIQSKSPSLNFLYGNGWGLPLGFTLLVTGPPGAGKSLVTYEYTAAVHRLWEDGIVLKYNSEFREKAQLTQKMMQLYGIDQKRYMAFEVNRPDDIYDKLSGEVATWCEDGMPLKLVVIDSLQGVQGKRLLNAENASVMDTQIGDVAQTHKNGLKQILEFQRKYKFSVILTSHVAIELDAIEQKRNGKYKTGASVGVQHFAEYKMWIEKNVTLKGKVDAFGNEMTDESKVDLDGRAEIKGHKIRVVMKDSSMGPKGRHGEFTFDYDNGIVNGWEELFLLGRNRGIINPTTENSTYLKLEGWEAIKGAAEFKKWFKGEPRAQDQVLKSLREQDLFGTSAAADAKDAAALENEG